MRRRKRRQWRASCHGQQRGHPRAATTAAASWGHGYAVAMAMAMVMVGVSRTWHVWRREREVGQIGCCRSPGRKARGFHAGLVLVFGCTFSTPCRRRDRRLFLVKVVAAFQTQAEGVWSTGRGGKLVAASLIRNHQGCLCSTLPSSSSSSSSSSPPPSSSLLPSSSSSSSSKLLAAGPASWLPQKCKA
jgi:hypothetical protein